VIFRLSYRDNEIYAEVEAETKEEALEKIARGEALRVEIEFHNLWPDYWEVEEDDWEEEDE